jgi:hypothetical protein
MKPLATSIIPVKMILTAVPGIEAIYPIISLCAAIAFTRILWRRTAQLKAVRALILKDPLG